MKTIKTLAFALSAMLLATTAIAQQGGNNSDKELDRKVELPSKRSTPAQKAKQTRKVPPAFQPPDVQPGLPHVLLIGDSISIGYMVPARKALSGQANVWRPNTNCGPTTKGIESIEQWLGDRKWDVIHFNFGLHDLKYLGPNGENLADPKDSKSHQQVPIEQYAKNLSKLAKAMKATGATVIWCDTTPVPEGAKGRVVGDSKRYNAAARKAMEEIGGIEVDPLYEFAKANEKLQKKANVHYSPEGSQKLAEQVASVIRKHLP